MMVLLATEPLIGHKSPVYHVSFSPTDNLIASASYDGTVRLWQTDGTLVNTLKGHQGLVIRVRFSPDGKLLATAGKDNTVRLWKLDGTFPKLVENPLLHGSDVNDVSFRPRSETLLSFW